MKIGNLRDLVTFQRRGATDDGYGNVTSGDWADIEIDDQPLTVWADMLERLGGEKLASGAQEASRAATIRVRRTDAVLDVTSSDRIAARGEYWNIRSIATVGRKGEVLEFLCEAGGPT
ncbi:hypothetical protein ATO6_15370 [Oceanicola sp. 22II-s10i]|uniref:head-tail adaptor protein n=1 Tax=Oceanicola sp. 22II-s10i TaxID=1317116 RepID=UPI000B5222D5|nr:head-tail adaptor protein [Oceanicola sp. 22II-s10i]OWU83811.1 hypothetical protein ATO6_15370 [Oceanicola sp. 22II-s10i]